MTQVIGRAWCLWRGDVVVVRAAALPAFELPVVLDLGHEQRCSAVTQCSNPMPCHAAQYVGTTGSRHYI